MAWRDPSPLFIPDLCTPSPAFTIGLSTQYNYSPLMYSVSPAPTLRSWPLPFMHGYVCHSSVVSTPT